MSNLKAPFIYFGGKRTVGKLVWNRLGDLDNYLEPFYGSGAVHLLRPHPRGTETVNDINDYLANFWRAMKHDPETIVDAADWSVNETDLHAIHRWLVLSEDARIFHERMKADPDYFDPRIAGRWVWGLCCWIGGEWCQDPRSFRRPGIGVGQKRGNGIHAVASLPARRVARLSEQRPHIGDVTGSGMDARTEGLHERRPRVTDSMGVGIHANPQPTEQVPILSVPGCGMDATSLDQSIPNVDSRGVPSTPREGRPQLADAYFRGRGFNGNDQAETCKERRAWLLDWFARLQDRLRNVRVCCGHWLRICDSPSVTTRLGLTGVFLDPPYPTHFHDGTDSRSVGLYVGDERNNLDALRDEVLAYCKKRGSNQQMRIAVCGYDTDGYAVLEDLGWQCVHWKARGGYGNAGPNGQHNAARERIWFSPHCNNQKTLFDSLEDTGS
jgi:site-specific DNA-adenine methylase